MTDRSCDSINRRPHHFEYDDADDVDRCIYCGETRPAETR